MIGTVDTVDMVAQLRFLLLQVRNADDPMKDQEVNPADVIALDDNEFGKF